MVEAPELKEYLSNLAQRFEDVAQNQTLVLNAQGWGQFLDAPKRHRQIGLYGTAAGVIVLALAERGQSILMQQAVTFLVHVWEHHEAEKSYHKYLVQNLRLAILNLALRVSKSPGTDSVCSQIEEVLMERILPSGLWGNYWINDRLHDPTPRIVPSAIVLLSFSLFHNASQPMDSRLMRAADLLEEKLALPKGFTFLEEAAISTAVLAAKSSLGKHKAISRIAEIARSSESSFNEQAVYFYDYEYSPDSTGQTLFSRDYFILPEEVFFSLAGFLSSAPIDLQLRAEATLNKLLENFSQNSYSYRSAKNERLTSLDQAWAAIFLKVALDGRGKLGFFRRFAYELRRQRKDNWYTATLIPFISVFIVAILSVVATSSSLLIQIVAAFATLTIGGLYGPLVIKLFLRQE